MRGRYDFERKHGMIHKNKILILLGHIRIETLHRTAQNITHKESKEQNLYVYKQKYIYVRKYDKMYL